MKLHNSHKIILPGLLLLFTAILFSSCLKNDSANGNQQPIAGLMAFNLAPSKNAVGFAISGNLLTNVPIGFTNYTGGYINLFPGSGNLQSFDFGVNNIIDSGHVNFEQGKYYSVFLVGDTVQYKNIFVQDNFDSLTYAPNTSFVRYINAVPESIAPVVKISDNTKDVFNESAAFKTVSQFKPLSSGNISISASNGKEINVSRNISLDAGKAYTILLVGDTATLDPLKQVQIKYVYNVTITP